MEFKTYDALPEEAIAIREEVFLNEQGFKREFDEFEGESRHFVLYVEGKGAGTARVRYASEFGAFKIGRIAVRKEYRGKHFGEALVSFAEDWIRGQGGKEAAILAQDKAIGFYEKLGYGKTDFTRLKEHCPHTLMKKIL